MKYNKIVTFFLIALPLCMVTRALQLFFTIDAETGFHFPEFVTQGRVMTGIIFGFAFFSAVFAFVSHRSPEHPPKQSPVISTASIAVAVAVIVDVISTPIANTPVTMGSAAWQQTLLVVSGMAAALFFVMYGLFGFVKLEMPKGLFLIPTVFYIIKVTFDFLSVASIALISESVMHIAAECCILVFMLQFAKLYLGMDREYNFRKIMASGFAATVFCLSQSVAQFVYVIFGNGKFKHLSAQSNLNLLITGIFISVFTFSHFSKKNCE